MAGGEFIHKRHLKSAKYLPLVLTDPGSVFVFEVKDRNKAEGDVRTWQEKGLPLPQTVTNEHGKAWQDHPYLPENGFGEIAVNLQHGFASPDRNRLSAC